MAKKAEVMGRTRALTFCSRRLRKKTRLVADYAIKKAGDGVEKSLISAGLMDK